MIEKIIILGVIISDFKTSSEVLACSRPKDKANIVPGKWKNPSIQFPVEPTGPTISSLESNLYETSSRMTPHSKE